MDTFQHLEMVRVRERERERRWTKNEGGNSLLLLMTTAPHNNFCSFYEHYIMK